MKLELQSVRFTLAQEVGRCLRKTNQTTTIRNEKIRKLTHQLRDGCYVIDPKTIAAAIWDREMRG